MGRLLKSEMLIATNDWAKAAQDVAHSLEQAFAEALDRARFEAADAALAFEEHCSRQADLVALDGARRAHEYLKSAQDMVRSACADALRGFFAEIPRLDLLHAAAARATASLSVVDTLTVSVAPGALDAEQVLALRARLGEAFGLRVQDVAVVSGDHIPEHGCEVETPREVVRCDLDSLQSLFVHPQDAAS